MQVTGCWPSFGHHKTFHFQNVYQSLSLLVQIHPCNYIYISLTHMHTHNVRTCAHTHTRTHVHMHAHITMHHKSTPVSPVPGSFSRPDHSLSSCSGEESSSEYPCQQAPPPRLHAGCPKS